MAASVNGIEDASLLISSNRNQSATSGNSYSSIEEQLEMIESIISLFKIRLKLSNAKWEVAQCSSRYLTLNNVTTEEINYNEMLYTYSLYQEQKVVYEFMFQRAVDSRIIWDIMRQNIRLNCSFPLPRPPLQDGPRRERQLMNSMRNIADTCVELKRLFKLKQDEDEKYLENVTKYVDQIEKFRVHRELNRNNRLRTQVPKSNNPGRQINYIKMIQIVRSIITSLIVSSNINLMENPEIVSLIRKYRHVVTESNIREEAKKILYN